LSRPFNAAVRIDPGSKRKLARATLVGIALSHNWHPLFRSSETEVVLQVAPNFSSQVERRSAAAFEMIDEFIIPTCYPQLLRT
jgi:hypothetical protein